MAEHLLLGGTDGFRGEFTANSGPGRINPETFAGLTYALLQQPEVGQNGSGVAVISRDTRPSGEALLNAIAAGALYADTEVADLDVAPTPVAQKIAKELGGIATIVATASHNPEEDNGWKGMIGSSKPPKSVVRRISDTYWRQVDSGLAVPSHTQRSWDKRAELLAWYQDMVVENIEATFGQLPLTDKLFVVDDANGASRGLTSAVLERLGAEVTVYRSPSDIINDGCGAADLRGLKNFLERRPDLTGNPNFVGGLAKDGDADRLMGAGIIKEEPKIVEINGNHIIWALAQGEPGAVGTEYTNSGLVRRLEEDGIGFEYCANGDIHVTERLRELQQSGEPWTIGGEFTGHIIDTRWLSSGDGVRTAAWLAAFAATRKMTFGDIHTALPLWPEKIDKVGLNGYAGDRTEIAEHKLVKEAIARARDRFGPDMRVVMRPSGTEDIYRIWAESNQGAQAASDTVDSLVKAVQRVTAPKE